MVTFGTSPCAALRYNTVVHSTTHNMRATVGALRGARTRARALSEGCPPSDTERGREDANAPGLLQPLPSHQQPQLSPPNF